MHPALRSRPRPLRRAAALAVAVAIAAAALALSCLVDRGPPPDPVVAAPAAEAPPPPEPRAEAAPSRLPVSVPPAAPAPTFAGYLERLVDLGLETSRRVDDGDRVGAERADAAARALFDEAVRTIADAHEPALATFLDLPLVPGDARERVARAVCLLFVDYGLAVTTERTARHDDRGPLDRFVLAMLASLPRSDRIAEELGARRLVDKPHLGAAHEATVLELAGLAAQQRFPARVAAGLLATLWRNLEAQGVRTHGEIQQAALRVVEDGDPGRRLAAIRLLLGDPRNRELAIEVVRRADDRELLHDVAMLAAEDLEPKLAYDTLDRLGVPPDQVIAAYLTVANRAPRVARELYDQRLADNTGPSTRAELVRSIGFTGGPDGVAMARFAMDVDPDPGVQMSAMFVLTANAPDTHGEKAIERILDDPRTAADASHLGGVVLALQNLGRAGLHNAVDRIGQRLRSMRALRPGDRETLDRILAENLPGGRTSR